MKIFKNAALVMACVAGLLVPAAASFAATTAPSATVGYHDIGTITIKGEPNQCFTATSAADRAPLGWYGCIKGDPLQQWVSFRAGAAGYGFIVINLAGHANLVVSGLPGPRSSVELWNDTIETVPLTRTTYVIGSIKKGSANYVTNLRRLWLAIPKRGHSADWTSLASTFTSAYNKAIIFNGTWTPENET